MGQENEIVFEDLHGIVEDESVTVDLDAATKDDGISRAPAVQAADDVAVDDDCGHRQDPQDRSPAADRCQNDLSR